MKSTIKTDWSYRIGNRSEEFYEISWEGLDKDGKQLPDGEYQFVITYRQLLQVPSNKSLTSRLRLTIRLQASSLEVLSTIQQHGFSAQVGT